MKRFWKRVMEWETVVSLMYTGSMFLQLYFCWLFDNQTISTTLLWTLLLACIAGGLFQRICFSDWIIKKMRHTWRRLLFVLLFLPTLAFTAWKAEWFPTDNTGSWVVFIGIFFLIFLVSTIWFDISCRITGRKYDGMISQYRKQKEEDENKR